MNSSGFFCYKNYIEPAKAVLSNNQYEKFAAAILDLGIYGQCTVDDPIIASLLNQISSLMNATDRKYKHYKKCGKMGGRPRIVTRADIKKALVEQDISTQKELAEYFNCSVRTISRRISKDEIRRILDEI